MSKSLYRSALNRALQLVARVAPGRTTLRPLLHRLRGVKIDGDVFIGDDVYLENEYPECIEMRHGSAVNFRSTLIAHFRGTGRIVLHENARVAACCTLACSPGRTLNIGEGSFVSVGSLVKTDVAPYTVVAGVPARPIARITIPLTDATDYFEFKKGLAPLEPNSDKPVVRSLLGRL